MRISSLLLPLLVVACAEPSQTPAAHPPAVASVAAASAVPPSTATPPKPAETGAPTDVVQLVTGRHHACALLRDGGLFCWGNNAYGQLGDTRGAPRLHPALVAENVTTVATSARLTCAAVSGALTCFGAQAKAIGTVAGVVSLSMNDTFGCAVTAGGELHCFATSFAADAVVPRTATRIEGIHGALDVAIGGGLVCARTTSDVRCFAPGKPPEPLAEVRDVVELASTYYGVCTLGRNGDARCIPGPLAQQGVALPASQRDVVKLSASNHTYWPRRADGSPLVVEKLPASLGQVLDLAHGTEGGGLICVIDRARHAACWGERADGMLGDGGVKTEPAPVRMAEMTHVLHLGDGNTLCPILKGGTADCLFSSIATPPKLSGVRQISRSCLRSSDARVKCAGYPDQPLLGHTGTQEKAWERNAQGHELVAIPGLPPAIDLSVRENFGCATLPDGRVWCWGSNGQGELGRGQKSVASNVAAAAGPVPGIALAAEVRTGETRSCARLRDGSLRCWGDVFADERLAPVPMPGFPRAVSVAVGSQHVCVASTDGRVFCQGGGAASGTLSGEFHAPMEIPGPRDVVRVLADGDYACALEKQGRVLCWGDNASGQLGDGTYVGREAAAPVLGIDSAREVALEQDRACALLVDGSVWCWGKNEYNELGTGHGKRANEPVPLTFKR